jgi:hypothetical protein
MPPVRGGEKVFLVILSDKFGGNIAQFPRYPGLVLIQSRILFPDHKYGNRVFYNIKILGKSNVIQTLLQTSYHLHDRYKGICLYLDECASYNSCLNCHIHYLFLLNVSSEMKEHMDQIATEKSGNENYKGHLYI